MAYADDDSPIYDKPFRERVEDQGDEDQGGYAYGLPIEETGRGRLSCVDCEKTRIRCRTARRLGRRRLLVLLVAAVLFVACVGSYRSSNHKTQSYEEEEDEESEVIRQEIVDVPSYPPEVLGPPTESFWDNLRSDTQYITGWVDAGWTNNFMTVTNLLYVALLANRTAVLPPTVPIHIPWEAGFPYFSDVIDIPRLASTIQVPIIEWSDLKSKASTHVDQLGCWTSWADIVPGNKKRPRNGFVPGFLKLDASYTPVPANARLLEHHRADPHVRFAPIAALTSTEGRVRARLPHAAAYPGHSGHRKLPDVHMACFDFLYYASAVEPFEYEHDFAPAWSFVGTHAHWTPKILSLTRKILAETFHVVDGEANTIPPFISIHIRHGDFGRLCPDPSDPSNGCFAPLSAYAARVDEVKAELRGKGIVIEHVLVTSDEKDERWWDEVRELGWTWIDHEALKTSELFGVWYTLFVDVVAQSLGAGFVGTKSSTMSLLAGRRVADWNGGPVRYVRWDEGRVKAS